MLRSVITKVVIGLHITLICVAAHAAPLRNHAAKAAFQRANHCPITNLPRGACKGYVIDHIKPLACGGADAPHNMQWQTKAEAKAKDKWERKECRH